MRKLITKIKNKFYITISLIFCEQEQDPSSRFVFYVLKGKYTWDELVEKLKKTKYGDKYTLNRFKSYNIFKHLWFLISPFDSFNK